MISHVNEAAKANVWVLAGSHKIFQEKEEEERKKGQMEEGKEGGRNRFETWLALEAAAQRTGGSPGLSPGIETLPAVTEFTGEPENLARKFCFKGLPPAPERCVFSGPLTGLRCHST